MLEVPGDIPELGLRLAVLTDVLVILASLSRQTLKLGHDRFLKISSNLLLPNDRPGRVLLPTTALNNLRFQDV